MALLYGRAGHLTVTFGGCRAVLRELGHRHKPDDVSLMMQDCHQLSRGLSRRAFIRWRAGSVTQTVFFYLRQRYSQMYSVPPSLKR
jgi:hypothetical protein